LQSITFTKRRIQKREEALEAFSRRQFVRGSAAIVAGLQGFGMGKASANPLGMDIGLQLYSVKDELEKDLEGTLKTVAAIGYRQVESSLSVANKSAKEIRAALLAHGLGWKSAHTSVAELKGNPDKVIGAAQDAGVKHLICSAPWIKDPSRIKPLDPSDPRLKTYGKFAQFVAALDSMTRDDWKWNADVLNETGEKAKKAGLRVGYHNHTFEFKKLDDGTLPYDALLKLTDPELVDFQLDCGWMVYSGYDPIAYLAKYPKRYCSLHIKDLARDSGRLGQGMIQTTEVGSGTIDWKRIFATAGKTTVGGYYVEQEPPFARPPLESARISYDYLHALSV
jgi:sugar phosphate isomerase/epimerase